MFKNKAFFASLLSLTGNLILFVLKLVAGLLTNSLALISDAINSFTDIFASLSIAWAVNLSQKSADADHPFGHDRAEPIAGLIVAIFTGIVAFEVLREGVLRFFDNSEVRFSFLAIGVLVFAILLKLVMYFYFTKIAKNTGSCAISATAIDSRNDVLASSIALVGLLGVYFNIEKLDSLAAIVISLWIGYSGYKIGKDNLDYLMGHAPSPEILDACRKAALSVAGVKDIHDVLAHYVGVFIHIEIHVEVDKNLTTIDSHTIGKKVQAALLKHSEISQVFVHIDPV